MKKTTSSLLAATAALGLIAASAGVAFAAETPTAPEPSPAPTTRRDRAQPPAGPASNGLHGDQHQSLRIRHEGRAAQ